MKRKFLIILAIFGMWACEDDLIQAPISSSSSLNFYQDADDFEQAVNATYNALDGYAVRHFMLSDIRSDLIYSPGTGVRDWNPVNNFENTLSTNVLMSEAWDANFNGILRANTVLDKIDESLVPDADVRNRLIGEAKFLRALFYFDLVRWFGKVPLLDHVVTPTEALEIPRSAVADVYELIEADLTDAISDLPESYSVQGRATSLAAKALLAKVYLTKSGPSYGIEGPGLDANMYSEALTLLNDVINSGQFSWVNDYASIFSYDNEGNSDIVFDEQNINDLSTGDRGIGTILPTSMYDEAYGRTVTPFAGGVPGDSPIRPSESFLATFDEADVRDDFAILPFYIDDNNNQVNNPQFVKFLDLNKLPADRFNWGINFPIIRYTDVLMMKAEALLQSGGSQTDVDAIVNMVRERAGLDAVSNVDLDMLLEERAKEFMAEGLRWHDLVRTGKVLEVMNAWEVEDDASEKIDGVNAYEIIYAIPLDQLDVKEGLYEQNEGY
ncbi:RagB/SusD family nutrient uptake outer membrane protein [Chondrinema litorale]|uniref:RagB/SusD family nutrient uptake outer membrane protein n=1 Tax=Chondrinema litorale TaxID=2994555 RepID=UPI00254313FC|nr:RagB/SusD family nutrient uptake outer membrane protein [Chondrinema litorale]UZR98827.1 RagB/SusD family nutrient uptake outer membrane protein [Chondrinema litorale]